MEARNIAVEGTWTFATAGDIEEDVLAITPMHPRLHAVQKLLTKGPHSGPLY